MEKEKFPLDKNLKSEINERYVVCEEALKELSKKLYGDKVRVYGVLIILGRAYVFRDDGLVAVYPAKYSETSGWTIGYFTKNIRINIGVKYPDRYL